MTQTKNKCLFCGLPVYPEDEKAAVRYIEYDEDRLFIQAVCGRCNEA